MEKAYIAVLLFIFFGGICYCSMKKTGTSENGKTMNLGTMSGKMKKNSKNMSGKKRKERD
jgi:uncharacterized membrane protein YoaK (UPF0700 family)